MLDPVQKVLLAVAGLPISCSSVCLCTSGQLTGRAGQIIHDPEGHDEEYAGQLVRIDRFVKFVHMQQEVGLEQRSRDRHVPLHQPLSLRSRHPTHTQENN